MYFYWTRSSGFYEVGDIVKKDNKELNRRELIELLSASGISLCVAPSLLSSTAKAAEVTNSGKFMLFIEAGSWDGLASGLLQPTDSEVIQGNLMAKWPRDVFVKGQQNSSVNPNVNFAHASGNLLFSNYTKPLLNIAQNMCYSVGSSRTAGHHRARSFQNTGADELVAQSSWLAGFAHALSEGGKPSLIVGRQGQRGIQISGETPNVATVNAHSFETFEAAFKDSPAVPNEDYAKSFWDISKNIIDKNNFEFAHSKNFKQNYKVFLDNLVKGFKDDAILKEIQKTLNETEVKKNC